MNSLKFKHVHMIQDMQLLLNFIIIIFNASIFLVATDYICNNGYERIFLEKGEYILVIRMKRKLFYYHCQMNASDPEFSVGDTIYLCIDKEKIWYLNE